MRLTGVLSLIAVLAACAPAPTPTAEPSYAAPTTPTSTALPEEPSQSSLVSWGPLGAVIPPQDGADTARTEGTLRINDVCVVLESPGEVALLFWPADRTTWKASFRSITFENYDGSVVTVHDGNNVVLGGSGDSEAESGISGADWVRQMTWVAPPASSCAFEAWWGVGAVAP